jgi:hypothetical protein
VATRKKAVFARRPELQRFAELKAKVLRTDDEAREYAAMLADTKRMRAAKTDLLAKSEKAFDPSMQLQRMYQVSYLDAALSWRDNPERQAAMGSVLDVLREPTVGRGMSIEQVKSIAGDRIELAISLRGNDGAAADAFRKEVQGTPIEKVLIAADRRAAMANLVLPSASPTP